MTEYKKENIDNLLSKFFSPGQAEEIKKDFASSDALFEKFPASAPSQQILEDIKQKITQKLEKQKHINWASVILKTAAVAAIVIVISAIQIKFNHNDSTPQIEVKQEVSIWQNGEISTFETQIEQLKDELLAIKLGEENGTNGVIDDQVDQLELEIVETENTFWKG